MVQSFSGRRKKNKVTLPDAIARFLWETQWLFSLKFQRQEMERKWWESRSLLCSSFNLLAAAVLYASLHFFLVSSPFPGFYMG